MSKVQEAGSIFRIGFGLSKWPHLHKAYFVAVCNQNFIAVYSISKPYPLTYGAGWGEGKLCILGTIARANPRRGYFLQPTILIIAAASHSNIKSAFITYSLAHFVFSLWYGHNFDCSCHSRNMGKLRNTEHNISDLHFVKLLEIIRCYLS